MARRITIDTVQAKAATHGGRCFSLASNGQKTLATLECARGHVWTALTSNILKKNPTWCPDCSGSGGEKLARRIMELIFSAPFPKRRPTWLLIEKGRLELDGFNEGKRIAFEYHGVQHYDFINASWFDEHAVANIRRRDELKRAACWQRGVSLVVIPEFKSIVDLQGCINQVEHSVLWAGVRLPKWKRPGAIHDLWDPLEATFGVVGVARLRSVAEKRGGKLLSVAAVGNARSTVLMWQCQNGHSWMARPYSILEKEYWCKRCSDAEKREGLEKLSAYAADRNGRCLAEVYTRNDIPVEWECALGHRWFIPWRDIKRGGGHWCAQCYFDSKRLGYGGLQQARAVAQARGGLCLSDSYSNMKTKMLWQCGAGHQWSAKFHTIKAQKHWCPICARVARRKSVL